VKQHCYKHKYKAKKPGKSPTDLFREEWNVFVTNAQHIATEIDAGLVSSQHVETEEERHVVVFQDGE
jgi:hypothetical protein